MRRLVEERYSVRGLARKSSNVAALRESGVEIAIGDLGDEQSVAAAVKGVDFVVHAGAAMRGTAENYETATIQGTRNVLKACREGGVKKLVHISSCTVYEIAGYSENQLVTEDSQLERNPLQRGLYSASKLQSEALVTAAMGDKSFPIVVLRPGTLYGPGTAVFTSLMGIFLAWRIFVVFGDGTNVLPLIHVDNAVDAVVECMRNSAADNQIFNVMDQDPISKKAYVERVIKPLYPGAIMIYVPMPLLVALTWMQEKVLACLGKKPFLTVYRLASSQNRIRYSTSRIEYAIGWRSRIKFEQGVEQLIRYFSERRARPRHG